MHEVERSAPTGPDRRIRPDQRDLTSELPLFPEETVPLAKIPAEVRSRVMAATAHARVRWVEQRAAGENLRAYEVYAVAGDRFVHMVLALRPDESVAEETETVLLSQIVEVVIGDDHAAIEVSDGPGRRRIPVPFALLPALPETAQ